MSVLEGVYKQSGQPDTYVPIQVDAAGAVATTGGSGGVQGGATAAEITDALTATNANMEASLQSLAVDSTKMSSTIIGGKQLIGGSQDKWRDSFESLDSTKWDYVNGLAATDLVTLAGNTQGASFMEICLNAMASATVSEVKGLKAFAPPYRLGYGGSISQRQYGELVIVSVAAVDETGNRVIAAGETEGFFGPDLVVKKISVTSNVATVSFDQPHNLHHDDLVVISAAADNRMNIQGRLTGIRSRYSVTIPLTATNGNYLQGAACKMNRIALSKGSSDVAGFVYMEGTSANAVYFARGQGSSESLSANTGFGTSYTDGLIVSPQPYSVNIQPRFQTEMVGTMDLQRWMASAIDSMTAGLSYKRTQNLPDPAKSYTMFFDVVALPNRSVPIEIDSIVKTGTTTATVTTVNPHGLVTGSYVYGFGSRDQSTLANLTAPTAVTVTGANTLTLVWGTAVSTTYRGGMLLPQHGGYAIPAALNTAVMGTSWYNGRLYLGTYISTPFLMGDVVRLIGVRDTAGTLRPNMSGRFRVVAINPNVQEEGIVTGASTTTGSGVITMPVTGAVPYGGFLTGTGVAANSNVSAINPGVSVTVGVVATATNTQLIDIALTGVVLEPIDFVAPANDQPLTLISMGAIYRETTLRTNFARCLDYTRTPVELTGAHYTADQQQSIAIHAPATLVVSAAQSTAAAIGTEGAGAWVVRGSGFTTIDIASAALTTIGVTTGSAIDVRANTGSMQINCDSTAVTGTTPRMITRVQGSLDGTNFVNVFDIGVITDTTKVQDSPVIPVEFRAIRYVRDVRGTTPSFSCSVNRTVRPGEISSRKRRMLDRVVALTAVTASTEWLYVGGCTQAQMMCTPIASLTGVSTIKAQLCQGNPAVAGNWYDIPGAPTLTPAVGTAVATATFTIGNAKFMRFVPTAAATTATADTYELVMTAWE